MFPGEMVTIRKVISVRKWGAFKEGRETPAAPSGRRQRKPRLPAPFYGGNNIISVTDGHPMSRNADPALPYQPPLRSPW